MFVPGFPWLSDQLFVPSAPPRRRRVSEDGGSLSYVHTNSCFPNGSLELWERRPLDKRSRITRTDTANWINEHVALLKRKRVWYRPVAAYVTSGLTEVN